MIWVLLIALTAWVAFQQTRILDLEDRLKSLKTQLDHLLRNGPSVTPPVRAQAAPAPRVVAEPPKTPLAPPPNREPLPQERVEAFLATRARSPAQTINLAAWLSENGLAWLGGGALALGGLFLVTYAVQRGVFTPQLRLAAAVAVGLAMVAGSEVMRRLKRGNPLAAALSAGAGAATLYGVVWAAERLYHFIDLAAAAPLLALISAGLLGLAFLHGAPLALLAIVGAYAAPLVTGGTWDAAPLTAYLALILATGQAVAALRRWTQVGPTASAGALLWVLISAADWPGYPGAVLVVLTPTLAALAATWRAARDPDAPPADVWGLNAGPALALAGASVMSLVVWMGFTTTAAGMAWAPAVTAGWLAVLGAIFSVRRLAPPLAQLFPYVAAILGLFYLQGALPSDPAMRGGEAWSALLPAVLIGSGLAAGWFATEARSRLYAAAGAVSAALALAVGAGSLHLIWPALAWASPAVGGVLLAASAALLARRSHDPATDISVALWIWAAAYVLIHALYQGADARALPVIFGALSLAGALLHNRLGWRGLGSSAIAAALAALAAMMTHEVAADALAHKLPGWALALDTVGAAGVIVAGGWSVRRRDPGSGLADALGLGALLVALTGIFLLLRIWVAQEVGGPDLPVEWALRTILLMSSGLLAARVSSSGGGRLSRWRPHVFLGAGLLHTAVVGLGMLISPEMHWKVQGPPVLDTLMIAYLAPALLAAAATRSRVSENRKLAVVYAASALILTLLWAGLEIRRLFQGPTLREGIDTFGRAETAAYAVMLLVVALGLVQIARRVASRAGTISNLAPRVADLGVVVALAFAVIAFGYFASPWWGPINRALDSNAAAALLIGLHVAGAGLLLMLANDRPLGRAAQVLAALQVAILVTLGVRMAFRGLDLAPAQAEARLETWVFSAVWALYGLAVMILGVRRHEITLRWTGLVLLLLTTTKVFLFDMARLDGVIRAASFLALGVLLIAGALAARRFGLVKTSGTNGD